MFRVDCDESRPEAEAEPEFPVDGTLSRLLPYLNTEERIAGFLAACLSDGLPTSRPSAEALAHRARQLLQGEAGRRDPWNPSALMSSPTDSAAPEVSRRHF